MRTLAQCLATAWLQQQGSNNGAATEQHRSGRAAAQGLGQGNTACPTEPSKMQSPQGQCTAKGGVQGAAKGTSSISISTLFSSLGCLRRGKRGGQGAAKGPFSVSILIPLSSRRRWCWSKRGDAEPRVVDEEQRRAQACVSILTPFGSCGCLRRAKGDHVQPMRCGQRAECLGQDVR